MSEPLLCTSNQLMSRVRPGVREVLANAVCPVIALISDDLPTLERPTTAISGKVGGGKPFGSDAEITKVAFKRVIVAISTAILAEYASVLSQGIYVSIHVIGITGGIATGKSQVSAILRARGAEVIDADVLARQVVEPDRPAWHAIVARFGQAVVDENGYIDRKALGAIVFENQTERAALVAITHPQIAMASQAAFMQARDNGYRVVFYEAALLVENGAYKTMSALVVVTALAQVQLERIMKRDQLTEAQAKSRVAAQMPQDAKTEVATWVIDNSGDRTLLQRNVDELCEKIDHRFGSIAAANISG
jgi:dephospho-CoA kinase